MRLFTTLFLLAFVASLVIAISMPDSHAESPEAPDWLAIATAKAPEWPSAQAKVEWREDFKKALEEAKTSGRPIFVTIRCLPCKQCSDFDKDVLEGGGVLDPLLTQFITLRLTTMRDIDERILPFREYQDMDLSWWGYFLSDEAALYGVYGGMDESGDSARISPKGLAANMRAVLNHHYNESRKAWGVDRAKPEMAGKADTPKQLKGWKSWAKRGANEVKDSECLHCHQVNEIVRQPDIDAKSFSKKTDFYTWPFPENAGFSLERDDSTLVKAVAKGGVAEKAGLKAGDRLIEADGARLFSEADFRAALNRVPYKGGKFSFSYLRGEKVEKIEVSLKDEWKQSDLGWRKSVAEAQIGGHFGFPWPLKVNDNERKQRGIKAGTMAVKPWVPGNADVKDHPALKAGLKASDFITAINGESPDVFARSFCVWFRMNFESGDEVKLTVKDAKGKEREIKYKAK